MKYEPKILKNNTAEPVEFFCGGQLYQFAPGEQKPLDGYVSYHATKMVNTGLTIVGEEKPLPKMTNIENMSWKDLRLMEDKDGKKIYKMGMNRKELIEAIKKCLA